MQLVKRAFYTTVSSLRDQLYFIATILLSLCFYFLFLYEKPLNIFPNTDEVDVEAYDDRIDHGNSKVRTFQWTDSLITFQYELDRGFSHPYTGLTFFPKSGMFNLDNFNKVEISFLENSEDNFFLSVNTEDPKVINKKHRLAQRRSHLHVKVKDASKRVVVNLSDLITPNWWYEVIGQSPNEFDDIDLSKTGSMQLTIGVSPRINHLETIKLLSIKIYKDNTVAIFILVGFVVLALFVLVFINWLRLYKLSKTQIEIKYKAVEGTDIGEVDKYDQSFLEYIHTHYDDPDLTLTRVADETGVQERAISKLILDKYNCNFKTYVNRIRVEEAQRLLTNPKLNISEIAYSVGFNSPSAFNKVFKKITGTTPSSLK